VKRDVASVLPGMIGNASQAVDFASMRLRCLAAQNPPSERSRNAGLAFPNDLYVLTIMVLEAVLKLRLS